MHKSWQVLYQCRASVRMNEVLMSPGFFDEPNIFASTKYFFLCPFQVYYWRQGETLSRFPLESCREPSLPPERPSGDTACRTLPAVSPSHSRTSPYQLATLGQHPKPVTTPSGISLFNRSKAIT